MVEESISYSYVNRCYALSTGGVCSQGVLAPVHSVVRFSYHPMGAHPLHVGHDTAECRYTADPSISPWRERGAGLGLTSTENWGDRGPRAERCGIGAVVAASIKVSTFGRRCGPTKVHEAGA